MNAHRIPGQWRPMLVAALVVIAWLFDAGTVFAHDGGRATPERWWSAWNADVLVIGALVAITGVYLAGRRRIRRRTGGRRLAAWREWCVLAGVGCVAVALLSPVDAVGESLFAVHMAQHMLLFTLAPPLLVLGAPPAAALALMPGRLRPGLARLRRGRWAHGFVNGIQLPIFALASFSVVLWGWHVPRLYEAALNHGAVHVLEHLTFVGAGLLFWWPLLSRSARVPLRRGIGTFYVFAGMAQGIALSALLSFSERPWYAAYAERAPDWGISAAADQQLGGVVMWAGMALPMLTVAGVLFVLWLNSLPGSVAELRGAGRSVERGGISID